MHVPLGARLALLEDIEGRLGRGGVAILCDTRVDSVAAAPAQASTAVLMLRRGDGSFASLRARAVVNATGRWGSISLPCALPGAGGTEGGDGTMRVMAHAPASAVAGGERVVRAEAGVRVCGPTGAPLFAWGCRRDRRDAGVLDPKWSRVAVVQLPGGGAVRVEYRTFCFCVRGETVWCGASGDAAAAAGLTGAALGVDRCGAGDVL